MHHSSGTWAPWFLSACRAATLAWLLAGGAAMATEIKGAAILTHPCGQAGVTQMGLLNRGMVDEANILLTPELRAQWEKAPAAERRMVAEMAKAMAPTEADYLAAIQAHGVLMIDGTAATLTVRQKTAGGAAGGTSTTTQKFKMTGATCLVSR